jgi:hypothetical protein
MLISKIKKHPDSSLSHYSLRILSPPLISKTAPVEKSQSPRARDDTALLISLGNPHLSCGMKSLAITFSFLSLTLAFMSASKTPGRTSKTRIPSFDNLPAKRVEAILKPALDIQYSPLSVDDNTAEIDEIITIRGV